MKTNDIHVCAFPKSGITYFGFLLVAARLKHNGIALTPTMYNIDFLLIDIHKMSNVAPASLWHDGLGDLFKTHGPFMAVPNAVYLLRNPLDTLRSYFHFRRQLGSTDSARDFLSGPEGITAWVNHVKSWLLDNRNASQSLFVTEYEDLQANPHAELRALAAQWGLEFAPDTLDFAVQAASLERMRTLEAAFVSRNPVYAQFNLDFVRKSDSRAVDDITPELVGLIKAHAQPVYEVAKSKIAAARKAGQRGRA
jgi:sulfotransferase family protein